MLNRLKAALAVALLFAAAPAFAAGTLPLAMAQQVDINGKPLAGCQVSFFVAGTVASPQNSFSDFSLTQNPSAILSCDQAGRVPMFWLADGLVHVRMTDASGSPVIDTTMQVLGPSSGGGGGGGTVDPTTIFQTGALMPFYGTGPRAGFVRGNGLTIGNVTSGASERANADTQNLFIYLYGADPNLIVSGGRTGNALNDFNASKTIALPDWRGRALAALDDMGNTAAGRLTATYFGTSATVLGAAGGNQNQTMLTANLPPYTPQGTLGVTRFDNVFPAGAAGSPNNGLVTGPQLTSTSFQNILNPSTPLFSGTPAPGQVSAPFSILQPSMLATIYIKL